MTKDFGKGKTANTLSFLEAQKELRAFLEKNNFAKIPEEWIKSEVKNAEPDYGWYDEASDISFLKHELYFDSKDLVKQEVDSLLGLYTIPIKNIPFHSYITNIQCPEDYQKREKLMDQLKTKRFLDAGGIIPGIAKNPKKSDTTSKHFNLILSNDKPDTWVNEQGEIKIKDMHDKHLIATMRFLVRNWDDIRNEVIKTYKELRDNSTIARIRTEANNSLNAISHDNANEFLHSNVRSFYNLYIEVCQRFGQESYASLMKGN